MGDASQPADLRIRLMLSAAIIVMAASVMAGWLLNIGPLKSVLPGLTTMKANTALGLLAGAVSVPLSDLRPTWARATAASAAALAGIIGLLTLFEYVTGAKLGIDELLFLDPDTTSRPFNGRMSPATAVAFAAAGLSLMLLVLGRSRYVVATAHLLTAIPAAIGLLALSGYAYGIERLHSFGPFVSVALNTGFGLCMLAAAVLLTRRSEGWQRPFLGRPIAFAALLQISAISVLVPFVIGLLIVVGTRQGLYQPAFSPALFAVAITGALIWIAFRSAGVLATSEAAVQHAQETARESELRLQLALSGGRGIGMWDWDVTTDRVVADERFARLHGVDTQLAKTGAPTANFLTGIHADDRGRVRARIATALSTGEPFSEEYRLVRTDGGDCWVAAEGRCQLSPEGEPLRFPGVGFDITDRKIAEQRLRELNADLERRVVDLALQRGRTWQVSPELLGVVNAQGYFETSNPAWRAVLGWSEDEVASTRFLDFIHPDDLARTQAAWAGSLDQRSPALRFDNRFRCSDGGYRWLSWVAVPDAAKVYCSARDITEAKEQAEALERAQEALRQSQKMEAVGQLTGGIAHDFNNLLAGIGGSLEMLQSRIARGRLDAVERYITAGQSGVKRAAALTHRLLAFSRRQTLDPRPTNINRLVAEIEDLVRRTVGPAIHVEVVGAVGLWPTLVDANQLENALLNLCINARDAMPDGGRLTIETANKWLDERAATERDLPPGQYISLCVTDTGTGMTSEVAAKAFDPFFTTKPLGEGTGLGLSMIYGFARQSGGQVRIYSEVGSGTTMCLYLPRHDQEAAAESLGQRASTSPSGDGEIVLIIDDEPTIRMLITEVLEDSGYTAVEAPDGPSGLRVLQSSQRIDLLITDVGLPGGLNGRQIADAARCVRPGLKVLFITGYAENAAVGNGHLDRNMQVVTKPFAMDVLAAKIREMITT